MGRVCSIKLVHTLFVIANILVCTIIQRHVRSNNKHSTETNEVYSLVITDIYFFYNSFLTVFQAGVWCSA